MWEYFYYDQIQNHLAHYNLPSSHLADLDLREIEGRRSELGEMFDKVAQEQQWKTASHSQVLEEVKRRLKLAGVRTDG